MMIVVLLRVCIHSGQAERYAQPLWEPDSNGPWNAVRVQYLSWQKHWASIPKVVGSIPPWSGIFPQFFQLSVDMRWRTYVERLVFLIKLFPKVIYCIF